MSQLNKVNIAVAAANHSKLDLSCDHVTTMSFLSPQPVYYRHMIKGEHLNFDCLATCRLAPMPVPTYGRMRLNLHGFAIPYRLAFPQWHQFFNDVIASDSSQSSLVDTPPYFTTSTLTGLFISQSYNYTTVGTSTNYDFYMQGSYYLLTYVGRRALKILRSLGYDLIPSEKGQNITFNALALLAYAKIYIDWYANAQYLNSADVLAVEQLLSYNNPSTPLALSITDLARLISLTQWCIYDDNGYFTNAWDNPVSPNNGQFTSLSFTDVSGGAASVGTLTNGTPYMKQGAATSLEVGTTYVHDALKRLTDYQKRHALAGARSIDRVLAQFGIQTDYLRTMRSIYVGSQSIDINVGDIYATGAGSNGSDTSSVGDYAGRGGGQGSKKWDFTTDEECIFIVVASIIPSGGYYQGYDRNNRHLTKTDFFVPEFDGLGVQAIEKGEVYVSNSQSFVTTATDYLGVFGYNGRYGEYKRPINRVTGDLSLPTIMAGGDSWHLNREITSMQLGGTISNVVHSLAFTQGSDQSNYNRIFDYTGVDVDKFYCNFHFDVGAYAPCKPLTETYDFEEESKSIKLDSNGTTLN